MVFEKELAILYGFFNVRISKKTTLLQKTFFNFYLFILILCQNAYNFVQNC